MERFLILDALARHDLVLNIIYAMCAVCVVYTLVALVVYLNKIDGTFALIGRAGCLGVGAIVVFKTYSRFDGGDAAQWLDIAR